MVAQRVHGYSDLYADVPGLSLGIYSGPLLIRTLLVRTLDNPNGLKSKLIIFTANNSVLFYK